MFVRPSILKIRLPIKEAVLSLKVKNSEGYDRIPHRILADRAYHNILSNMIWYLNGKININ